MLINKKCQPGFSEQIRGWQHQEENDLVETIRLLIANLCGPCRAGPAIELHENERSGIVANSSSADEVLAAGTSGADGRCRILASATQCRHTAWTLLISSTCKTMADARDFHPRARNTVDEKMIVFGTTQNTCSWIWTRIPSRHRTKKKTKFTIGVFPRG